MSSQFFSFVWDRESENYVPKDLIYLYYNPETESIGYSNHKQFYSLWTICGEYYFIGEI
jgi:hypothetical protein